MVQHGSKDRQPAGLARDWGLNSNETEVAVLAAESVYVKTDFPLHHLRKSLLFLSDKVSVGHWLGEHPLS